MMRHGAVIIMAKGNGLQPVQVTQDALTDIQSPPRYDADRLIQYLDVFATIAEEKIRAGQFAFDGRVWITGSDVRAWRCSRLETALTEWGEARTTAPPR
jgi:hypothetical protein